MVVIIVNFNGGDLTTDCLASLSQSELVPLRILVIDNASTDGSNEVLAARDGKDIELIANEENAGFARACNQGMRRALELGADYAFLFNNDARLEVDALAKLVAAAENSPRAALVGGKIYFGDGKKLWCAGMSVGFHANLQELRGFGEDDNGEFDREEEVDALTGCGLLIRRAFLEEGGFFDEDFFVYVEDLELSVRARKNGWHCLYVPQAVFYHDAGSTSGQGYSSWRKYMLAYNLVLFLRKQGSFGLWLSFLFLDVLLWPLVFFVALMTGRGSGALAKGRGLLHAFAGKKADPV